MSWLLLCLLIVVLIAARFFPAVWSKLRRWHGALVICSLIAAVISGGALPDPCPQAYTDQSLFFDRMCSLDRYSCSQPYQLSHDDRQRCLYAGKHERGQH